jgi:hypothetical protein
MESWAAFGSHAEKRFLPKRAACCRQVVDLYSKPNMTADQIRAAFEAVKFDPLKAFSTACRAEFLEITFTA